MLKKDNLDYACIQIHWTGHGPVTQAQSAWGRVSVPWQIAWKVKNEMALTYEKNEVTPPGFEPGAQTRMIQRVTTVPRSHIIHVSYFII